ncbi:MAG: phage portal protein [Bdellovibrionales bacterium]
MNLFSRIGTAVKYAATGRLSMSALAGGFEGAMNKRRLIAWRATEANINTLVSSGGDLLRARARQIVRSNPYASNAANSFASNAVGDGIRPSSLIEDQAVKNDVLQLWKDWILESDADGLTDFYGMQALIAHALFEAGECFVRFRPRRLSDGLVVPLQLQLLESEMLPISKTELGSSGNVVRCGIEFNRIGQRVAYHFYCKHPGDSTETGNKGEIVRVQASEVLHIYRPQRPGQIRGVPWVAPALVKLFLLDQYDDAELDRKKIAALFAGFITKESQEDNLVGESEADAMGAALAGLSPGTMQVLLPGEDIKFSTPADVGGAYEPFQYRNLLAASAALGVPYVNTTGDLKAANYSSIRAGTVEFRRRLNQFQEATLIFQLCRPIWKRWIQTAVLSGAIHLPGFAQNPRLYNRVKWIKPKWEWVDPLKDRQAEQIAQEMGWKAPSDIIEAEGNNVDETFQRIANDQAHKKELGIQSSTTSSPSVSQTSEDDEKPEEQEEDENTDDVPSEKKDKA